MGFLLPSLPAWSGPCLRWADGHATSHLSLADLGAPSVVPYLRRWMERPSWKTAYKTDCMYSTAVVACLANFAMMAKDMFDDGRKLNLILDNLRRRDTDYNPDFVPPTN